MAKKGELLHGYWIEGTGPEEEVVVSVRVRIARNLVKLPFPYLATDEQTTKIQNIIAGAAAKQGSAFKDFSFMPMEGLDGVQKQILVEKHMVSPYLARNSHNGALFLRNDGAVSIMINEEDHLRIQSILPGLQLEEAWQEANRYDDLLEGKIDFAFDERFGYLTACPTNVGTGLRASVMLHLPALILTKQISRLLTALSQVGLAVRGLYGEGTEVIGNLVQISNQVTLGQPESEILRNLEGITRQVISQEQSARQTLLNGSREKLADRAGRAYGLLNHARVMSSHEAMQLLSDFRLGYDLGLIKGYDRRLLNELLVLIRPACLQFLAGRELSPEERDRERPAQIKKRFDEYRQSAEKENK
ncbi:MAG: protein arginine kinase [Firmicutes bacterium]|nr:protein arginine kinase [Bacillota bacterium]